MILMSMCIIIAFSTPVVVFILISAVVRGGGRVRVRVSGCGCGGGGGGGGVRAWSWLNALRNNRIAQRQASQEQRK